MVDFHKFLIATDEYVSIDALSVLKLFNEVRLTGFNAFDDARMKFDVRFYLVAILFIIFDLEIAFLFPWAVALKDISLLGFWSMIVFLAVLTIGFAYEWKKGALEWE